MALCSRCGVRDRWPGIRQTWCRPCKSEYQRGYRAGKRSFRPVLEPVKDPITGCWLWQGFLTPNGYGVAKHIPGRSRYAHRRAYEEVHGLLPETLVIDHLCSTRACVNPEHLEPVTLAENTRRGVYRALERRGGLCGKGHPMDRTTPKGRRYCSTCMNASNQRKALRRGIT